MDERAWPTLVVLSAVCGRLLCEMDEMIQFLQWAADDPFLTQMGLGPTARKLTPLVLERHPQIREFLPELNQAVGLDDLRRRLVEELGPTLVVGTLAFEQRRAASQKGAKA